MPKLAVSLAYASAVAFFAVIACSSKEANANVASSVVSGGVQAGAKTCTELLACCGKIRDKGTHDLCVASYKKKNGNDTDCELAYQAFQSYCDPDAPKPQPPKPVPKPRP